MSRSGPRWARLQACTVFLLICAALLGSAAIAGAARSSRAPRALAHASRYTNSADRALVADARALKHCESAHRARPSSCAAARRTLQRAGARLAQAERQLARLGSRATSGARTAAAVAQSPREAPVLTSSGQTLSWSRVAGMSTYVFVRKVPGQPDQYSVVTGTSITPPAVPGATVRYAVRTTAWWSSWSAERAIAYPGAGEGGKAPNPQAAPSVTVSGQTISWNSVAGVGAYVLVRKVPGLSDVYSEVNGTSVTPPVAPGKNVRYSVRTAVEHSAWAPEVAIAYPASTPPPVSPPPPVTPPPVTPPVEEPVTPPPAEEGHEGSSRTMIGLDIGGWAWESAINDEAGAVRYVRSSYKHFNSDSQMALLAKAGVKLLPLFGEGGTLASYDNAAFVGEIVSWFKRYGKGGTFWASRPVDLGATTAELINEPGNPYFYPDYANHRLYAEITKAVHSALEANFAAAVRPKLLVSYDGGFNGSEYGRAIFAAGAVADGVTVHPYGGHGSGSAGGNRERVVQAHSETGLPVYVTEVGWPTGLGLLPTGDSLQWSEQQQAVNLSDFIKWARAQGYVEDVTYFNYADYGINDFYGIVHSDGSGHKLSYGVLKAATAAS